MHPITQCPPGVPVRRPASSGGSLLRPEFRVKDRSHELLSGRTRPGWLALAAGFSAACLCIVAAYFFVSSTPWRFGIFWAGLVVLTVSCAWSLWFRTFSTAAQIGIL